MQKRSKNWLRMWTLLRMAIGSRKTGIIELMMWTVKPSPIRSPIAQTTEMAAVTPTGTRKSGWRKSR